MTSKEFYINMIQEQIRDVQTKINELKEDMVKLKNRKFLVRFEDGTEEVLSSDDLEIVTDKQIIKGALACFSKKPK